MHLGQPQVRGAIRVASTETYSAKEIKDILDCPGREGSLQCSPRLAATKDDANSTFHPDPVVDSTGRINTQRHRWSRCSEAATFYKAPGCAEGGIVAIAFAKHPEDKIVIV
jgi:hypothetical protein